MSNPILNAEQFQRAVSSFGSDVEILQRVQGWISENVQQAENAQRGFADSVNKLVRAMGMQAENDQRKVRGESMAYIEADFLNL